MVLGKLSMVALAVLAVSQLPSPASQPIGAWRSAPEYVTLFAPPGAHTEAYRAYVSSHGLDEVLREFRDDTRLLRPPGAWVAAALLPSDAFGLTGRYDRGKLTRVYGATRARVVRGPFGPDGRPSQSWTLISPYPNPVFERLQPGTLLITLDLP